MATDTHNPTEQSATSLVGGIIDDMQELVKQQVQLTKKEMKEEIQKAAESAALFAVAGGVIFFGFFFVGFGLVHLIHWASSPAGSDPGRIPLWVCYGFVGVPLALIGGILIWIGRQKIKSIDPMHNPAADALKENVRWATNSK